MVGAVTAPDVLFDSHVHPLAALIGAAGGGDDGDHTATGSVFPDDDILFIVES